MRRLIKEMSFKVVSGIGGADEIRAELAKVDAEVVLTPVWTEEDLIKAAAQADAVMVGSTEPYTRKVIEAMEKCRVISRTGVGYNNIDVDAATDQGIPVAIVTDASIDEVSDHAMAFLLAFYRKLIPVDRLVRQGAWQLRRREIADIRRPTLRLNKSTVGVVGTGRIGEAFVRKANAFGVNVIIYDPYLTDDQIRNMNATKVDFEQLLKDSDYISIHCPATKETQNLFGAGEFKKMKPTCYLINTARGDIVDETALYDALCAGEIAGAGLDVTDPEPPDPDNPLLQLENVIVTAHSAFYSEDSIRQLVMSTVEAVVVALQGQWPRSLANPEVKEVANRRIK